VQLGYVDPQNLLFAHERIIQVREVAGRRSEQLDDQIQTTHFSFSGHTGQGYSLT
jgi:hypothetical protein